MARRTGAVVGTMLALLCPAAIAEAAFPGANGKIAFSTLREESSVGFVEVFTMNADGTDQTRLTFSEPGAAGQPHWSADGQKVAFLSNRIGTYEIYSMNADGTGVTRLTNSSDEETEASWSPAGDKLVLAKYPGTGPSQIFTMNADGSNLTNISNFPDHDADPAWSPDGTRIAFAGGRGAGRLRIWTMNPDGTNAIAVGPEDSRYPDWAPDGSKIAYALSGDIWVMNPNGSARVQLTSGTQTEAYPAWSPDGTKIAYHVDDPGLNGSNAIWTMNSDGTGKTRVSTTPTGDSTPNWQPLPGGANLHVSKVDSPDPAYPGEFVTYDVTVRNLTGSLTAQNVELVDQLPSGVTFVDATPSQGSCSLSGSQVTCDLGSIPVGAAETVQIRVEAQSVGTLTNSVSVTSDQPDHDLANNQATQQTTVNPVVGYARPKGANPVRVPLVPAFFACSGGNRWHGPPLAHRSCAPPVQLSQYVTVGTPDANGATANSIGSVRVAPQPGDTSTPADEADVALVLSMTDVRKQGTLADYDGELELRAVLRITDQHNGNPAVFAATVQDWPLQATAGCSPTASSTIGATCTVSTTADALLPGLVRESDRTIWQLAQIQVFDGGSDGLASTAGNTLFAKQGVFIP